MGNMLKILIFGSNEINRFKLLSWYLGYMKDFEKWGITKEEVEEVGFCDSLRKYPYMIGHCSKDQILDFFSEETIKRVIEGGRYE